MQNDLSVGNVQIRGSDLYVSNRQIIHIQNTLLHSFHNTSFLFHRILCDALIQPVPSSSWPSLMGCLFVVFYTLMKTSQHASLQINEFPCCPFTHDEPCSNNMMHSAKYLLHMSLLPPTCSRHWSIECGMLLLQGSSWVKGQQGNTLIWREAC